MRASLITLFALLVLAATLVSAGADPGAEKDKKQSPKASTTEIETLVKDLGSEDGKKASAALKSLVKIGQPAVSALFDALDKNEQENKRCLAILALGRIREKLALGSDERGSKVIEDRLLIELDDPNDEILSVATSALTENHPRSTKSIPVLIAIMKSEERRSLARSAATRGLSNLGPRASDAIPVLLHCLENKVEHKIEVKGKPGTAEYVENIRQAVRTSVKYIEGERTDICKTLGAIGPNDARVVAVMTKALKNSKEDPLLRGYAAEALAARTGEVRHGMIPDVIEALKQTADKNKDPRIAMSRGMWISVLGRLKYTKSEVPFVLSMALNPNGDENERSLAVEALSNNPAIAQSCWLPLFDMLRAEMPRGERLRMATVIALGLIPPSDEEPKGLAGAVKRAFDELRRTASPELEMEMEKTLKKIQAR